MPLTPVDLDLMATFLQGTSAAASFSKLLDTLSDTVLESLSFGTLQNEVRYRRGSRWWRAFTGYTKQMLVARIRNSPMRDDPNEEIQETVIRPNQTVNEEELRSMLDSVFASAVVQEATLEGLFADGPKTVWDRLGDI